MKTTIATLAAILLLSFSAQAVATPGRTNKSGCHKSKRAGYHCHR